MSERKLADNVGICVRVTNVCINESIYARNKAAVGPCLHAGDHGKGYDLKLQVTSYSIEEDWMTGVSYIRHVYSEPYADKKPTFGTK
jgi:hypothetical protein